MLGNKVTRKILLNIYTLSQKNQMLSIVIYLSSKFTL